MAPTDKIKREYKAIYYAVARYDEIASGHREKFDPNIEWEEMANKIFIGRNLHIANEIKENLPKEFSDWSCAKIVEICKQMEAERLCNVGPPFDTKEFQGATITGLDGKTVPLDMGEEEPDQMRRIYFPRMQIFTARTPATPAQ